MLYDLPKPRRNAPSVLALDPLDLINRLVVLIPPPPVLRSISATEGGRIHRHRYRGVLAPDARLRAAVTARADQALDEVIAIAPVSEEGAASDQTASRSPSAAVRHGSTHPSYANTAFLRLLRAVSELFSSSLTSSIVHPRDIYARVIRASAAAVIFVHNHPSGDPTPSREDLDITRRLREVGDLVGVRVLDHIIIGQGRYVSFVDDGYW